MKRVESAGQAHSSPEETRRDLIEIIERSNIDTSIHTSVFRDFNEVLTWLEVELEDNELISE